MGIYWKSEAHKRDYDVILDKFERSEPDRYYRSLAYLIAATGKAKFLLKHFSTSGVKSVDIKNDIEVYSSAENAMIQFALHLFNHRFSDITFHDTVRYLDTSNFNCVMQAINIRYMKQ